MIIANGLVATKMYEVALSYIENAAKIASATPDAGYQFTAQTTRIEALIGLRRFDAAQRIIEDVLIHARETLPLAKPILLGINQLEGPE